MEPSDDLGRSLAFQREAAELLGVPAIRRHVFLCCDQTQPKCCQKQRSLEAWEYLKRRLDVAQRVLEDTSVANGGIPDKPSARREVAEEIDEKFGNPSPDRSAPTLSTALR